MLSYGCISFVSLFAKTTIANKKLLESLGLCETRLKQTSKQ